MNQSELANSTEFSSPSVPGFSVSVNGNEAFIVTNNSVSFGDGISQAYTQSQIRTLIGVMLDVHEEMEIKDEDTEEDQMGLFENIEEEETVEEIIISPFSETEDIMPDPDFSELVGNFTTFLMMNEDMENERISKEEIFDALHILRDSINSYLEDSEENDQEETNQFKENTETE